MPHIIILLEGDNMSDEDLMAVGLTNAKQLVVGSATGFGVILHVSANTMTDLGNALIEFAKVPDVKKVITLAIQK